MSDDQLNRTMYVSKSGKPYMVFHNVQVPELKSEGVVICNMIDGGLTVLSKKMFDENFKKIKQIQFKDYENNNKLIKNKQ